MDDSPTEKQAIEAALNQDWNLASRLNLTILEDSPKNIPALNRLGRAYIELGKCKKAQEIYKKVLKIDPYNSIAEKNLRRINEAKPGLTVKSLPAQPNIARLFLEEPGKTKVVKLVRLACPYSLSSVRCADRVVLVPKNRAVSVHAVDNTYLGSLPDDLSLHLIRLIRGGNEYEAFVKGVDRGVLEIFIREICRGKKTANIQSFNLNKKEVYLPSLEETPPAEEEPVAEEEGTI